ncbi:MAG: glycosyltransferase family 2 protein [Methanosarcinales archaeon]|nr:glycosyltransferase family 2 protein [Methanosarcinales archaeon]
MPVVSIILPSMNEEKTIEICIQKALTVFEQYNIEGEIIVVDNSDDRTAEIANSMGAIVINSVKGYGNAYLAGLSRARGDYIAIADADNTYDLLELPKFLDPLIAGEADFVIGSRLKGTIKKGAMPWLHRYIGNPLLTRILNYCFDINISDAHCGMRAFTRNALDKITLKTHGMEMASEMVIEFAKKGQKIKDIPITYYARNSPSKLNSFQDGWRHIRFMMLYKPVPFLFVPGLSVFILGLFLTVTILLKGDVGTSRLHSFILGSLLLIAGAQIIGMGLYMKAYGAVHGLYEGENSYIIKILDWHSLENEIVAGIVIAGIGFIFGLKVLFTWIYSGYGAISEVENAVVSMVFSIIGVQIIFLAIFISVLMLERD